MNQQNHQNQPIDREVKIAYVRKIEAGDITPVEAAKDVGVSKTTIYDWRRSYGKNGMDAMPGKGHQTPEDAETRKLREKVKQLEAEVSFLKKAARYFAAE